MVRRTWRQVPQKAEVGLAGMALAFVVTETPKLGMKQSLKVGKEPAEKEEDHASGRETVGTPL